MVVPLFSSLFQPQPWVVIGDYNAVSSAVEKFSIHPINSPATSEFNNMMASSSLQDIGLAGSNLPAQIRGKHLVRLNLDHSRILLSSRPPMAIGYIPFKFEEMWIGHPSFKDLAASVWSLPFYRDLQYILSMKLKSLKLRLKSWNKDVFCP
ncbi:hypothetical protein MRB53_021294 [Persea americana]|uniref:Uncharacterized protein n=1 Tax=Persea americana TaxID=3435 RepID=A0ACC2L3B6_PERAE|nr:hypothetical protein MRB53_021294 [Persea americana]